MPYYQTGDYGTSGYYQGDPGLGRFFKRVVSFGRKVLPLAAGFIPGIGGIVAKGISAVTAPRPRMRMEEPPAYPSFPGVGLRAGPLLGGPPPDPFSPRRGPVAQIPMGAAGCPTCPSGFHPAKDPREGGRCVRNRRMNPTNPRALRRAIRRLDGFGRLAKRMGYTKRKGR